MTFTETDDELRQRILVLAARKMRDFGYRDVKPEDIMGEYVLRLFFKHILEDDENDFRHDQFQRVRGALLAEIAAIDSPKCKPGRAKE